MQGALIRTYGTYAQEESLLIYKGTEETGSLMFNITGSTAMNLQTLSYPICLSATAYTIVMTDKYTDGWGSLYTYSFVSIKVAGIELYRGTLSQLDQTKKKVELFSRMQSSTQSFCSFPCHLHGIYLEIHGFTCQLFRLDSDHF